MGHIGNFLAHYKLQILYKSSIFKKLGDFLCVKKWSVCPLCGGLQSTALITFHHLQGRSKSLTSIDTLEPTSEASSMPNHPDKGSRTLDLDCSSASGQTATAAGSGRLSVPAWSADHSPTSPGFHRRRKLSTASKVSSSEFFTVYFECIEDDRERGYEEFVPATRGTCLRYVVK